MLLAIDTSTQMIGLALYDGTRVLCEMTWQSRNHHTIELSPAVSDLLERCGTRPAELGALGVALGPGSFTSLRIGLALVKGLALALKIPVVGVPTLDILAAAVPTGFPHLVRLTGGRLAASGSTVSVPLPGVELPIAPLPSVRLNAMPLAALLQAGRGRLALVWYQAQEDGWQAQTQPQIVTAEELSQKITKPTLVTGELSAAERQLLARKRKNVILLSPARALRRPAYLAEIAWQRWQAGRVDDVMSLAPIYLHVNEAIQG
jgi:tRNA threonylcarbamoyladenosine biosynthesis protein TsaB